MRLTELNPRWLTPNMLAFLCPHCKQLWLTVKSATMREEDQFELFEKSFGEDWNLIVVPCSADYSWNFSGADFETLSINPSVDASNSGHWHGYVTNGECR